MFQTFLQKVHIILGKFSHSVAAKTELGKWTSKALVHSCPTRWWSEYDCVKRIIDILEQDPETFEKVCEAMNWKKCSKCTQLKVECPHLSFDDDDLSLMKKFLEFFSEFKAKSDVLGGESYSNVHLVFPYTKELSGHVESFMDDELIGNFAQNFHLSFTRYFDFIMNIRHENPKCPFQPYYLACSMLSPIFYNGLTEEERDVGRKFLLSELKKLEGDVASTNDGHEPEVQLPGPSIKLHGLKFFSKNIEKTAKDASSNTFSLLERKFRKDMEILELDALSACEELQKQADMENLLQEDPTLYWVIKEGKYNSKLPLLACGLLAAPSSSVPSERLFSIASLLSSGNSFFANSVDII